MGAVCEQRPEHADHTCRLSLHKQLRIAALRLRQLAQEMIQALEIVNGEPLRRVPQAYVEFYRAALLRLDEIDLENAKAFVSVQEIAAELVDVHQAVFAMYFDPARTKGTGGKTAPMALH